VSRENRSRASIRILKAGPIGHVGGGSWWSEDDRKDLPEVSLGPDGKFSVCLYGDFDGARDHDQGLYIEAESLNELATKLDGVARRRPPMNIAVVFVGDVDDAIPPPVILKGLDARSGTIRYVDHERLSSHSIRVNSILPAGSPAIETLRALSAEWQRLRDLTDAARSAYYKARDEAAVHVERNVTLATVADIESKLARDLRACGAIKVTGEARRVPKRKKKAKP
jgi:hypothetical protein